MGTSKAVIAYAKSQVGYHEGRANGVWNNIQKYSAMVPGLAWSNGYAWCCTFVFASEVKGGNGTGGFQATASVANLLSQAQKMKRFTVHPTVGAAGIINGGEHTFLVTSFDDTYVYTVEGNSNNNGSSNGDGVYAHKRLRKSASITGYAVFYYDEYGVSADPAFNGKWLGKGAAPKKTTTTTTTGTTTKTPTTPAKTTTGGTTSTPQQPTNAGTAVPSPATSNPTEPDAGTSTGTDGTTDGSTDNSTTTPTDGTSTGTATVDTGTTAVVLAPGLYLVKGN